MGFTTGVLSGATFTGLVLYLGVQAHTRLRVHQSSVIRNSRTTLHQIIDPSPPPPPPTVREERGGIVETAKDAWNRELTGVVGKIQHKDWRAVREDWERRAGSVFSKVAESTKTN